MLIMNCNDKKKLYNKFISVFALSLVLKDQKSSMIMDAGWVQNSSMYCKFLSQ